MTTLRLRDLAEKPAGLACGHGLCAGCAEPVAVRQILTALENPAVASVATGCLEVGTTHYPTTAWNIPLVHSAFENPSTTTAGMEAAHKALVRKGKLDSNPITFLAFGGDGATYDIGFQWLSGALERGHRFIYVCLNNEAYMNTGIQRSGATITGTSTTTTPAGEVVPGKVAWRKDLTTIIAAHHIPYVAQVAVHNWRDMANKVRKAEACGGPAFLNVLAPCPRGWRYNAEDTMGISRLAVETALWPLYEIENGAYKLSVKPRELKPVTEWLQSQRRFAHLLRKGNEEVVADIQANVDREWRELLQRCGIEQEKPAGAAAGG